jgi:hypothetical protein
MSLFARSCPALHRARPEDPQSQQTTSSVSEHYRNDASEIPGTISVWCAKSLHNERLLPEEMCMCVTRGRHCPTIDRALVLTLALDSGRPGIRIDVGCESSPTGEGEGRLHLSWMAVAVLPAGA